jgi:ornithine cyclodeaminase/alanine dehydrogenase-like protein (mu-crystallin family)
MARALVLGHADVVSTLPMDECIDAMASILAAYARGEVHQPVRSVSAPPASEGFMGLMPAHRGGERPLFALKVVCVFPANPARGLDAHQGTDTLFDGETGTPTAILDASAITPIRTAAVSGVATRLLARDDAAALVPYAEGAGALAPAAALAGKAGGGRVVCIVSGGNIDLSVLAPILEGRTP